MHAYMHTRMHTSTQRIHTHTSTHTYMHTHMHACTYTHAYMHAHAHAYIPTSTCMHAHAHAYIRPHIHTCMHACAAGTWLMAVQAAAKHELLCCAAIARFVRRILSHLGFVKDDGDLRSRAVLVSATVSADRARTGRSFPPRTPVVSECVPGAGGVQVFQNETFLSLSFPFHVCAVLTDLRPISSEAKHGRMPISPLCQAIHAETPNIDF
jgi:hypothetical protein